MAVTLPFNQQAVFAQLAAIKLRVQEQWGPRYAALQPREQLIVKVGAVILPCIILLFGIILPLQDKQSMLQGNVTALLKQAHEAELLATTLQQHTVQTGPKPATGSLLSQMDVLASDLGLRSHVTQMRPQSSMDGKPRLRVLMKSIRYEEAADLLLAIDRTGLTVQQMKMQKAKKSAYVQLQLLLAGTP